MKKQIGAKLKELRKENGWTQQQVADMIDISRVNYTRYELNTSEPDFDILVRLADIYDVSLDYIFDRQKYLFVKNKVLSIHFPHKNI